MSEVEDRLRRFMTSQFLFEFDGKVTEDSNLFDLGIIDSFGFIELVKFLEREFQITFTEEELIDSSLNTLANVAAAVRNKRHE